MQPVHRRLCVSIVLVAKVPSVLLAENWPQWRGARHDGISRDSKAPVHFSKTENLAWKLPLPNRAGATPVVWNDRIFLTSPAEDDDALLFMSVSTAGKLLWKKRARSGQ